MESKDIKYDTPIEVTAYQYINIMNKFGGMVAGRKDSEGKFWIKVWMMGYVEQIVKYL